MSIVFIGASDLRRVGGLLIRHALLEGFDALGDVAHHVRNLAAPAEHQQQTAPTISQCQMLNEPMKSSVRSSARAHPRDREFNLKLGVGGGKNKLNRERAGKAAHGGVKAAEDRRLRLFLGTFGRRREPEIEIARFQRVLVIPQGRVVGGHRDGKPGRQAICRTAPRP